MHMCVCVCVCIGLVSFNYLNIPVTLVASCVISVRRAVFTSLSDSQISKNLYLFITFI